MNRNIFEQNKLVYIPAILPSPKLYEPKNDTKNSHFWNKENSIWFYPNLLISAYHGMEKTDFRNFMEIDNDVVVFGDSGGFQAVTLGGDINPLDVIRWQMKYCNAGLILDRPPYEFGGSAQFSGTPSKEFFHKCLDQTKENAKVALKENKGENKIRLYGVIQGETWEQMNTWFDEMSSLESDDEKFDAWALSPKPSTNVYKIAMLAILCLERGIKLPLHILQVTGRPGIILSAYVRHLTQNLITIDSSSFSSSGRYGIMFDSEDYPNTFPIGDKLDKKGMKGWMCDCPVCEHHKMDLENWEDTNMGYLSIHNLYQTARFVKYMDCIVQIEENFFQKAREAGTKCLRACEILKYYSENGFEKTKNKYNELFINPVEQGKQKSLFGNY